MTLSLDRVRKVVNGVPHIYDLSLSVKPGSFNVLLGLTLAGKTTTMRLMAGLDKPTSGRVMIDGDDVTGVPVRKRSVAMVYQQFINYPAMSVFDNIASPLKIDKFGKEEIRERVHHEAKRLHIEHMLNRYPGELSGGQQQRVAMARALVRDVKLLLMDEPLVNLDYKLREELRDEMREIFEQRDSIVVYATTDPMEALTLGGNTAVLSEGQLVQYGSTPEVYHEPASIPVTQVFSDPPMNILDGDINNEGLTLGSGERFTVPPQFRDLPHGRYRIGIRPSHVKVHSQTDQDLPISGEVDVAEVTGSETFIHMKRGDAEWVVQDDGVHEYHLGDSLTVYVDPGHLFAFGDDGQLVASPRNASAQAA